MKNSKRPTLKQRVKMVEDLKGILPRIVPISSFGDDNCAAVKAQISVLEDGLSEEYIEEKWGAEENSYVYDSAMEARRWLDGEELDYGLLENWKDIASKD